MSGLEIAGAAAVAESAGAAGGAEALSGDALAGDALGDTLGGEAKEPKAGAEGKDKKEKKGEKKKGKEGSAEEEESWQQGLLKALMDMMPAFSNIMKLMQSGPATPTPGGDLEKTIDASIVPEAPMPEGLGVDVTEEIAPPSGMSLGGP